MPGTIPNPDVSLQEALEATDRDRRARRFIAGLEQVRDLVDERAAIAIADSYYAGVARRLGYVWD